VGPRADLDTEDRGKFLRITNLFNVGDLRNGGKMPA
jgi:hypothetical protein